LTVKRKESFRESNKNDGNGSAPGELGEHRTGSYSPPKLGASSDSMGR